MTSSTYRVTGMTCGHCVNAVSDELKALDGVSDVGVDLDPTGISLVTVTSAQPLRPDQVSAALDEAGDYRLVPADPAA
jgi:copper chaperone CopZ